jgi:hypothetical protein
VNKDEEIRQVASGLNAILDELREAVDGLTAILTSPPGNGTADAEVLAQ